MAVPPGVIDDIRSRSDLLNIIGDYVSLKKAGRNWIGLCPFHSEKTPSFSVSPEKGMFYCFGCNAGGDVFGFLRQMENLSFMEAVERLAQRAGVEISKRPLTREEKVHKEDRERLASLMEDAGAFYHRILTKAPEGEEGREYLEKRDFNIDLAKAFNLGWAPREWDTLIKHLASLDYSQKDMAKAGMASERQSGGFYDRFRGRIMFPIMSVQGRVLAFGGRLVADEEGPKYMNSPESPLYSKSRVLYGLTSAHKSISKKDSAIIVEGYFDLLAMVKHGFDNVVAPCGTALTIDQVRILTRYTKKLVPLFDADDAGDKARMRALDVILEAGAVGRWITLPEGLDPDDFLAQEGPEALAEKFEKAPSLLEHAANRIMDESGSGVEGRRSAMTSIAELLSKMSDRQARELYIREFSDRLGGGGMGAEDLLRREVVGLSRRAEKRPDQRRAAPETGRPLTDVPDYYLMVLALCHPELAEALRDDRDVLEDMEDTDLAGLGKRIIEEGSPDVPSRYLESLSGEKSAVLSRLMMQEPDEDMEGERLMSIWADTVTRVKLHGIKRRKKEVQARLSSAGPVEMQELLKKKSDLLDIERKLKEKR